MFAKTRTSLLEKSYVINLIANYQFFEVNHIGNLKTYPTPERHSQDNFKSCDLTSSRNFIRKFHGCAISSDSLFETEQKLFISIIIKREWLRYVLYCRVCTSPLSFLTCFLKLVLFFSFREKRCWKSINFKVECYVSRESTS